MEKGILMPMFYLPPISYFSRLINHERQEVLIEKSENFIKQTYRNRATIYSPNGRLNLIIPVIKGSKSHTIYKDVKISYNDNWKRIHWLSLQTSYRRSAYFEYYEDEFLKFYENKFDYLFDLNENLFSLILKLLKIDLKYYFTDEYVKISLGKIDYRNKFNEYLSVHNKNQKPYFQLFEEKFGFQNDLSIVDLLFNHGPQSKTYLK